MIIPLRNTRNSCRARVRTSFVRPSEANTPISRVPATALLRREACSPKQQSRGRDRWSSGGPAEPNKSKLAQIWSSFHFTQL